ncbi:arginine--tRNA ligase, putative [Plasmodium gallinaceum]|uniref:Arginine--tRNA ligase, putative n=1 Tax=Plasmodium gallinaceum TaxID=5849 RepID=A0A1J1GWP7_PLAGA|nr:arginine--tRNA ligase, putative [Plasmodium gallinaceum]CRG96687.1 arginine--tRNA ligase, putative [Plasmodium gallinaceum]
MFRAFLVIIFFCFYLKLVEFKTITNCSINNFFFLVHKRKNHINILFKNKQKNKNNEKLVKQSLCNLKNENIYTILNDEINNLGKEIVEDDTFSLPKYCLLEENKFYDNFEYQTSVIIFLENIIKSKKDIRKDVIDYLKGRCSNIIEMLHLSSNGILNIKIKNEYILENFFDFYKLYVRKKGEKKKKELIKKNVILLDFCGVNMGKHMHLGHLKSLFLGYALSNVFKFFNYTVKKRSHIGDWNVNIALIITFLILFHDNMNLDLCNSDLNEIEGSKEIFEINDINKVKEKDKNTNSSPFNQINNETKKEYSFNNSKGEEKKKIENERFVQHWLRILNDSREHMFYNNYKYFNTKKYENINLHKIEYIYKLSKMLYSISDIFRKCTKISLKLMYKNDAKIIKMWNIICSNTKKENEKIFKKFNIQKLIEKGEHFYVKYVPKILQKMKDANILFEFKNKLCVLLKEREIVDKKNSNNNYNSTNILSSNDDYYDIVKVNDEINDYIKKNDIDFLKKNFSILTLKSDVGYTYAAVDISAIYYRVNIEKANKIIYVVDENQRKHFMQVFSIGKYLNLISDNTECICLNYGYVLNEKKKKIKTKDISNNIFAKDILKINKSINENTNIQNKCNYEKYYEDLILSSIVYSYISVKNSKRQLINNILKEFHLEYIYIIKKHNEILLSLGKLKNYDYSFLFKKKFNIESNLKKLILYILRFNYIIEEVIHKYNIEKLCSYLFSFSQKIHYLFQKGFIKNINSSLEERSKFLEIINYEKTGGVINLDYKNSNKNNSEKKKKVLNSLDKTKNFEFFLKYIKNGGHSYTNNEDKYVSKEKEELEKTKTYVLNRILELIIMKSYLFLVSKIFNIINIRLINFY